MFKVKGLLLALFITLQFYAIVSAQTTSETKLPADQLMKYESITPIIHDSITNNRIIKQPNGPFAAMIFDEFALGIHLCIIFYDQMGIPSNGKWSISDRAWCNEKWGSDITSIYWSPNGKCIYVGTGSIYGDGGVFRLDLYTKAFTKIYPSKGLLPTGKQGKRFVSSSEIVEASKDNLRLKVGFSEVTGNEVRFIEEKTVTVPIKQ